METEGYYRFTWTPPTATVIGGSLEVVHDGNEQRLTLYELTMYYSPAGEGVILTSAL
jgi:hypothetical protein